MNTTTNRKRITRAKATIMRHLQMNRFIHEIEKEEPLDNDLLQTMLVLQPQIVR